ncbi:ribokinase [Marinoscillum furvescens]|uniref:Ribokinase n=1 Tax=Marinoscillum furvescens DSM 4134 TaxID=1122208 RepID=A0A3D9L5B3_MARFU|nr:ribokinase [Marinoscillum furvescens]RED99731.1 ribokinase [Marinoscillum furvescens DSM 4134]
MKKIVVVGSTNTDLVCRAERLPLPGETVFGNNFQQIHGGKGANQAVAVARAGGKPVFITSVGSDGFGEAALENLSNEGMPTQYVSKVQDCASGIAVITVDDNNGENAILVIPGANDHLSPQHIDAAKKEFEDSDFALVQLEVPQETVLHTLKLAKSCGCTTILNPAPAAQLPRELLQLVDIITPNETEAATLAGKLQSSDFKQMAHMLLSDVQHAVVITLGARGVWYATKSGEEGSIPAISVQPIDTTAAGDVFNGYLVAALARGLPLKSALQAATKAATKSVLKEGAQPSIPWADEV